MSYVGAIGGAALIFQRIGTVANTASRGPLSSFDAVIQAMPIVPIASNYAISRINQDEIMAARARALRAGRTLPGTSIIDSAIALVAASDLLLGIGSPNQGTAFVYGAEAYSDVLRHAVEASPDGPSWCGVASHAYGEFNAQLCNVVQRMQDLDRQMQTTVEDHSKSVVEAHSYIALILATLLTVRAMAIAQYMNPTVSIAMQIVGALTGVAGALGIALYTEQKSETIADRANHLASEYAEAAKAVTSAPGAAGVGAFAVKSGVQGVQPLLSAEPTLSGSPTIAGLAVMAGDSASAEQRAVLDALVGDSEGRRGVGTPAVSEAVPAAPQTWPSMGEALAVAGQPAKFSGHASQQMNLVNQTMAQAQRVASTVRQGRGAVGAEAAVAQTSPPASSAAEVSGAVQTSDAAGGSGNDGVGAAAGAVQGERAPLSALSTGSGTEVQYTPVTAAERGR